MKIKNKKQTPQLKLVKLPLNQRVNIWGEDAFENEPGFEFAERLIVPLLAQVELELTTGTFFTIRAAIYLYCSVFNLVEDSKKKSLYSLVSKKAKELLESEEISQMENPHAVCQSIKNQIDWIERLGKAL